jgi:hypothetical protein
MTDEKQMVDAINLPEAPASATAKVKSPAGFEWLVTTRSLSLLDVMKRMKTLEEWLIKHDWEPANGYKPAAAPPAPATNGNAPRDSVPTCPTHQVPMKPSKHKENQFYCTKVVADDDGTGKKVYCKQTATA